MSSQKPNELSERELDILKLVATGASNKEIAQKLFISQNTVKVHLRNIFGKIGAASRTEAAMYAVHTGIVESVSPQVLSGGNGLQGNLELSGGIEAGSYTQGKGRKSMRFLAIFGSLVVLIIIAGLIFDIPDLITGIAVASPTATPRVQWLQLTGLPNPRWGLAVTNYENQIYVIGGQNGAGVSSAIEKYDPQSSTWTELASKPTPVSEVNAVSLGGSIYVPGGKLSTGLPTDIIEIYDPQTNTWSAGSHLPKPLSAYALTVYEGRLYLFGGWDGNQVVNDVYMFDPGDDTWSEQPVMPTARSNAGAVVIGSKIFVIGGWDGDQALAVNEVFLPAHSGMSSPWTTAPALPSGRYGMGITSIADIIFILGGLDSQDNITALALSTEDARWGQLESPLTPNWAYLGATTIGTKLYALGGKTGDALYAQMWSYQAIFTVILPIIR